MTRSPLAQRYSRSILWALVLLGVTYHLVLRIDVTRMIFPPVHVSDDPNHIPEHFPSLHPDPAHLFVASRGAVASDLGPCSKMGVKIMERGGNAVDAAVTVALCIGSINAHSSGIGGGGFMTVRAANGTAKAINFREMAPGAAHKEMYRVNPRLSQVGGLAVAIPGEVAGLQTAHDLFGKLEWKQLFEPVIELNRNGFVIAEALAASLWEGRAVFEKFSGEFKDYLRDNGQVKRYGDYMTRPKLADTLELIAEHGSQVFYDPEGPIAPHLAAAAQERGGILTSEDFAHYNVLVTDPLVGEFLGRQVFTTPNPTSGPALLMGLNIIEGFDGSTDLGDNETHHLVETMKWMASARSELGDFVENEDPKIGMIVSKQFASELRENITDQTHPWQYYRPQYEPNEPSGTAHFSVVDEEGNAVSLTTTVNLGFGAKVLDPVTGVVLNSEMDDFSTPNTSNYFGLSPSIYNYIKPYHRPLSSTTPTIVVKDDRPEILIGAAGGSHIYTAVLQAIVRLTKYNLPLLETIAYPRVHHQLLPNKVELEIRTPQQVLDQLSTRKHAVEHQVPKTAMNGIHIPRPGTIHAVSDFWRKAAVAWGY